MTTFCAEHGISRKTFYAIWARAKREGQAAALEPRSRRPRTSPSRIDEKVKQQAVDVRAALERSGLDHGPISVHDKMRSLGMESPSIASLARIFREKGVARLEPKKKPRSSYRRFVYPAPNCLWQLDATEYVLAGGRRCVIFQLEDDHSRVAIASHVAEAETSQAALAVMAKGVAARGVPQRLLSDNGLALNPSRRGWLGQLVSYARSLGIEPITGRPGKPTTQGKNERFHQTLVRWLNKQPLAATLAELQEQIDRFDHIYNTERPHQGLPGRITPQQAWDATPTAEPPRPTPVAVQPELPNPNTVLIDPHQLDPRLEETGETTAVVTRNGTIRLRGVMYLVSKALAGQLIHAVWTMTTVTFIDHNGEIIVEYNRPPKGTNYVGNRDRPSPMS